MNKVIVFSDAPVLLVGGATGDNTQLLQLLDEVDTVVAADSGADWCRSVGRLPDAVIGDLDSVSDETRKALPPDRVHHIAEQDSTDFDKALRSISAPLVIGIGFLGGQIDHMLAAMTVLVRYQDRAVMLVGEEDVVLHAPPALELSLTAGTRVSLFPMAPVSGKSTGLEWPIDGISFDPSTRVGTSNRATGPISLSMETAGMLLILPVSERRQVQDALLSLGDGLWPAL